MRSQHENNIENLEIGLGMLIASIGGAIVTGGGSALLYLGAIGFTRIAMGNLSNAEKQLAEQTYVLPVQTGPIDEIRNHLKKHDPLVVFYAQQGKAKCKIFGATTRSAKLDKAISDIRKLADNHAVKLCGLTHA